MMWPPGAVACRWRKPSVLGYAFYQGHWYSYFGVVPALLLFLPYRAVTSLSSMAG